MSQYGISIIILDKIQAVFNISLNQWKDRKPCYAWANVQIDDLAFPTKFLLFEAKTGRGPGSKRIVIKTWQYN